MAKITFRAQSDYFLRLQKLEDAAASGEILEQAVHDGAAIVADEIRKNLDSIPEEKFHFLADGDKLSSLSQHQKSDIVAGFGLTPIARDKNGFVNTKAGFDGYGSFASKKYPQGVPNALLARSVESGSSVREKHPFVAPAVRATRKAAVQAMSDCVDEKMKEIFEE